MSKTRAFLVTALFLGLAGSAGAVDLETALAGGKIHTTVRAAVTASSLDFDEPLLFEHQQVGTGEVEVIRVTGMNTGRVEHIRVAPGADIGRPTEAEIARRYAYNVVGGSSRCVINLYDGTGFSTLIQVTDMDWNNLGEISGVNDKISSIQTGCNGVWFHKHRDFRHGFGLPYMYVPANTNMTNAGSMSNVISSFRHDIP